MFRRKLTHLDIAEGLLKMKEDEARDICLCLLRKIMHDSDTNSINAIVFDDKITVTIEDADGDNVVPLRRVK
tara:strand:+ start:269 stop:484 length:216 start_codon:yes stop_codon:yes gene_type:complete